MLLVLAKEIYECWLVSEDIILLTRKIIYTYLYVCIYVEKGGGGTEYFCFSIFEAILCF